MLSVAESKAALDSDNAVARISDSNDVEVGVDSVLLSERELKVVGESVLEFSWVFSVDSEEIESSGSTNELVESSDLIADALETSFSNENESEDDAMSPEEMKELSGGVKVVCALE